MMDYTVNIPSEDWLHPARIARYEKAMSMAQSIIDNQYSCRQVAKEYCIGKSTVSVWIEHIVKQLDIDMYNEIQRMFKINKKHTSARRAYYW